ncbi:MAG: BatD family protein [Elusimicrobiota bacterium]
MKKILILIAILVFAFIQGAYAQNVNISASFDRNSAAVGEQITMQISVSGDTNDIPEPKLPGIPDFNVYSSGRSQSVSIVNGKMSSSIAYNYVLSPTKPGKFTIGSATLVYKGQTYSTQPVEITVTASPQAAPAQLPAASAQNPSAGQAQPAAASRELFVESSVDKKTAYVNEQITLSFKFFHRVSLLSQPQYSPSDTTGFLTEDLPPQKNYYTDINGQRYLITEVKTALFATSKGRYTVGSAQLRCTVNDNGQGGEDIFNQFFGGGKTIVLKSDPITVDVIDLPSQNKPQSFTGAVGKFNISASLDKSQTETNQPITLNVKISGNGSIKTITEPKASFQNFRKYDTITSLNIEKPNYIVSGSKVFKIVLMPLIAGNVTIPPVEFTYFDLAEKNYKTINTPSLSVSVKPGTSAPPPMPALSSGQGTQVLSQDIRYIKTKLSGALSSAPIYKSTFLFALQFIPGIFFLIFWRYNTYRQNLYKNTGLVRFTFAYKSALKKLKKLNLEIAALTPDKVSSRIFDILCSYLADKFNVSACGIISEEVRKKLQEKNVNPDAVAKIVILWEELQFVQYAPAQATQDKVNELLNNTTIVLKELEKEL